MTAYAVNYQEQWQGTNSQGYSYHTVTVQVQAVSYELRVAQVPLFVTSNFAPTVTISRYSGALSGGAALTVAPLRDGSPAGTAIARQGGTAGGTQTVMYTSYQSGTWQPPFDVIVAPGHTLFVQFDMNAANLNTYVMQVNIYVEELRLSWHY